MTATTDGQLNQVNLDAVSALVDTIQERPEAAETTWAAEVRWTGAFRSEASVRGFTPIASDEPAALGGTDGARIALDGDIDLHTFLGLGDGHSGFSSIRVIVHLDTDADEAAVSELHRRVAATSPVGHTLSRAIPIEISHE